MTTLLVLSRALHFASGMMLAGVVAFRWLVLWPGIKRANPDWNFLGPLLRRMDFIFIGSLVLLIISELALFWLTSASMSGSSLVDALAPETLKAVLFQTRFGAVLQVRAIMIFILILLLGALLKGGARAPRGNSLTQVICGILAAGLFISNAWAGHAAAASGPSLPWRIAADATHLLAVAVWPTGLLFFNLFLTEARKWDSPANFETIQRIVQRFSQVSLLTVAVLSVTGIANSYFLVGSFSGLIFTPYGQVLGAKLFLFAIILAFASWNRWRLLPALAASDGASHHSLLRRLRGFVWAELGLAAAIIVVVSILGITPPPR